MAATALISRMMASATTIIRAKAQRDRAPFVLHWDQGLTLERDASVGQFHAQAFLVDGFQQAGPNRAMNVDGQADHAVRKRVEFQHGESSEISGVVP